jgi:hypothetical protein
MELHGLGSYFTELHGKIWSCTDSSLIELSRVRTLFGKGAFLQTFSGFVISDDDPKK